MTSMENEAISMGERIRAAFEEQSQRQTMPRNRIADRLAELAESGADFTAEDLWRDLRQTDLHLGRATVFRAIEMLADQGLLNRIEFADGSHTYRVCGVNHHHHLTCVRCHRVVDIDLCLPEDQINRIAQGNDFVIEGHSITLFGLCAACRSSKR